MTRDTFLGRMDDDSPRGFIPTRPVQTPASNSEARKRAERPAHPVPAVRDLLAIAWDKGFAEGAIAHAGLLALDNPYRSES